MHSKDLQIIMLCTLTTLLIFFGAEISKMKCYNSSAEDKVQEKYQQSDETVGNFHSGTNTESEDVLRQQLALQVKNTKKVDGIMNYQAFVLVCLLMFYLYTHMDMIYSIELMIGEYITFYGRYDISKNQNRWTGNLALLRRGIYSFRNLIQNFQWYVVTDFVTFAFILLHLIITKTLFNHTEVYFATAQEIWEDLYQSTYAQNICFRKINLSLKVMQNSLFVLYIITATICFHNMLPFIRNSVTYLMETFFTDSVQPTAGLYHVGYVQEENETDIYIKPTYFEFLLLKHIELFNKPELIEYLNIHIYLQRKIETLADI